MGIVSFFHHKPLLWELFRFFIMYHYYGYCSVFHYIPLLWVLISMSRFGDDLINSVKTFFFYYEYISFVKIALNLCAKGFFSCTVWKLEAFQSTKLDRAEGRDISAI